MSENTPAEIPTDAPTVTIAPGIYHRPIVTQNGSPTSYRIHWFRALSGEFVYAVRRTPGLGALSHFVIQDATRENVTEWLDHKGFRLA